MELRVTKEMLNFLLRFRCPKCEFDTLDPILIQEHLFQCLKKQDENDVIDDSEVEEFMLDIKEEFTETDLPKKVPIVIKIKKDKPATYDPEKAIEKVDDDVNQNDNLQTSSSMPFYCGQESCNTSFKHLWSLKYHMEIKHEHMRPWTKFIKIVHLK